MRLPSAGPRGLRFLWLSSLGVALAYVTTVWSGCSSNSGSGSTANSSGSGAGGSASHGSASGTGGGASHGSASGTGGSAPDASAPDAGDAGGAVTCTGVDPLVPRPDGPHGVYVFENEDSFDYGGETQKFSLTAPPAFLNQPTICGATFFVRWSEVDNGPDAGPEFDFTAIDARIAPWVAMGKRVNLLIEAIKDTSGAAATPAYVLNSVPQVPCNGGSTYPEFWSPTYVADYERFIQAVLAKYGSDPNVGYLRFGLTGGAEATLAGCSGIDDDGLTVAVMEQYVASIQSFIGAQPHTVSIVMPSTEYSGGVKSDAGPLDPVDSYEVSLDLDAGFGVGTESLTTMDLLDGGGCNPASPYCVKFPLVRGRIPIYAQTSIYCPTTDAGCDLSAIPDGLSGNQGPMPVYLPFATALGAQIFELYVQNFQVAYDTTFPAYPTYGASYRQALETEANVLGRSP